MYNNSVTGLPGGLILSCCFITIIFVIIILLVAIKNKREVEKKIAHIKLEKDDLEVQLQAIRGQLNPHFIFNSLNSIQELILGQKTDQAYDYVVLFSKLIRQSLHHSSRSLVQIEEEVAFLNTYLKLEKLRFENVLNYQLDETGITNKLKFIPSIIIHPFLDQLLNSDTAVFRTTFYLEIEFKQEENFICIISYSGDLEHNHPNNLFIKEMHEKNVKNRQLYGDFFGLKCIKNKRRGSRIYDQIILEIPFYDRLE